MGLETALLGSAIIGGISSMGANANVSKANAANAELSRESLALQERQQAFNQQRYFKQQEEYDKWADIYGPLQEDLGTYYKNLSGKELSNTEIANIQAASQAAKDKIIQSMAQSGRANSGAESYLLGMTDYNTEMQKAEIRNSADARAAAAKAGFLNLGLNQGNNVAAQQANTANSMQANTNTQANILANQGQAGITAANSQNAIATNYANQLQGLLGYGYRMKAGM